MKKISWTSKLCRCASGHRRIICPECAGDGHREIPCPCTSLKTDLARQSGRILICTICRGKKVTRRDHPKLAELQAEISCKKCDEKGVVYIECNCDYVSDNVRDLGIVDDIFRSISNASRLSPHNQDRAVQKVILQRGQTDFDGPTSGVSPTQKVLQYCKFYLPMHFASCVSQLQSCKKSLFSRIKIAKNKIRFVDFGCGPFTACLLYTSPSPRDS